MYEQHWELAEAPFDAGADARWYYPSEVHQAALLKLRYAVENRRGAALLAGSPGTGKTLLARLLFERLPESAGPRLHLVFPQMPPEDLLAYLAAQLDGAADRGSCDQSVTRIETFLADNAAQGRHTVVVFDEAHLLAQGRTLELLRLLLNFEHQGRPALTLILIGDTGLVPLVERTAALDDRLGVKCLLRPLTVEETLGYVQHRLTVAGAAAPLFTQEALERVHALTHGNPRRINRLCDLALLVGYAEDARQIEPDQIDSVAQDLVSAAAE